MAEIKNKNSLFAGLYVHVPFCKSRCAYCDFYRFAPCEASSGDTDFADLPAGTVAAWTPSLLDGDVEALLGEMRSRSRAPFPSRDADVVFSSVYFGGGTPSVLSAEHWTRIFSVMHECFRIAEDAEISVELNPDDVTPQLARLLLQLGVNRVSLGLQSLHDATLRLMRRRHDAQRARQAVHILYNEGFRNISIDLIYGLPGQSLDDFRSDLVEALMLPVTHMSAYALSVEAGTEMERRVSSGEWHPAGDELALSMYKELLREMQMQGWEHYEISNFARPGFRSRHNSSYWTQTPYLGLGPAAASYDGQRERRLNVPDLPAYVASRGMNVPAETEQLSDDMLFNELLLTRLRTSDGLPLSLLSDADRRRLLSDAAPHLQRGTLRIDADTLQLTPSGLFVSDDIISDLMRV